ncbi:MAG: histidine triad nucleotide-binding protein [Bdellovibrionota bacterium]
MTDISIFEKILNKEIPCNPVYEDEFTFAFNDMSPQAPIHVLIIPKKKIVNVNEMQEEDVEFAGRVLFAAQKIAKILNVNTGFRLVFNNGEQAGQTVFYMHCHFLAGRHFSWPPG